MEHVAEYPSSDVGITSSIFTPTVANITDRSGGREIFQTGQLAVGHGGALCSRRDWLFRAARTLRVASATWQRLPYYRFAQTPILYLHATWNLWPEPACTLRAQALSLPALLAYDRPAYGDL